MNPKDIRWLAAFMEGEGSFFITKQGKIKPTIVVSMRTIDYDVARNVARIFQKNIIIIHPYAVNMQIQYEVKLRGDEAFQWMMTLHSLMFSRRKAQIEKCITFWRSIRHNKIRW